MTNHISSLSLHFQNSKIYGDFMCINSTYFGKDSDSADTGNIQQNYRLITLLLILIVLSLYIYIYYESTKKKRWIKQPIQTTRQWDQTYCYLSLWLVWLVQLLIIINVFYLFCQVAMLSLRENEPFQRHFKPIFNVAQVLLLVQRIVTTNIIVI